MGFKKAIELHRKAADSHRKASKQHDDLASKLEVGNTDGAVQHAQEAQAAGKDAAQHSLDASTETHSAASSPGPTRGGTSAS